VTQRGANYPRIARDDYATPPYCVRALLRHVPLGGVVVDPCPGRGNIKRVLRESGKSAWGRSGFDFLVADPDCDSEYDVLTNPPYGKGGRLAVRFVERALRVTTPWRGRVVMLLPADFDSALTRRHLFTCDAFDSKVVLLRRIRWFDGRSGSTNHAWYVWDHARELGPPRIFYMEGV
jgi:hypothetical protein